METGSARALAEDIIIHRRNMESRNTWTDIFSIIICEAAVFGKKMEVNDVYLEEQCRQS